MDKQIYFKKLNNKGAALILAYFFLSIAFILIAGFAVSTVTELKMSTIYRNTAAAFWVAEAGINKFIKNTNLLNSGSQTYYYGTNYVTVSKSDTSTQRVVTSNGYANGINRRIQIVYPANPPGIFNNTIATGGNLVLNGFIARLDVYGPTRLTGTFSKSATSTANFEDKQEGQAVASTTLKYPDSNNNGTSDEFADFVQFNRNIVSTYQPSEVLYIQSNSKQTIYPNQQLAGKKIIYVEGTSAGAGDVDIYFDASWQNSQNLTVISTGTIDYVEPLQLASTSKLNMVSWDGYNEASVLYGAHNGVTYTHSQASFFSIFDFSETTGNLIANTGIVANEALSWKELVYGNPITNGNVPAGFEGLVTQANGGYSSTAQAWQEL